MSTIALSKKNVEEWVHNRKRLFNDVTQDFQADEKNIYLKNIDEVKEMSQLLDVPISKLLENENESDLDGGLKICKKDEGFTRLSQREGKDYYTYQHLVTTNTLPDFMPLKLTIHCNDNDGHVLNGGHDHKELFYVTKGEVRVHWETPEGTKQVDIAEGDSAYLQPGVPHSVVSLTESDSEILAINFK